MALTKAQKLRVARKTFMTAPNAKCRNVYGDILTVKNVHKFNNIKYGTRMGL